MEKQPKGYFTISDDELSSKEMILIAFTMLESRGYPGFSELLAILNDPTTILKIIRLLYGTTIKIPPLSEVVKCLRAAEFTFLDFHKRVNHSLVAKPLDIRQHMNITKEEQDELLEIFDEWVIYMQKNGIDVSKLMHINRENTKKRIKMAQNGKKWTQSKY